MRIAVYSGTFDPLHIGHLAIMRHLTDGCDYDRVYLIVSPRNPLKTKLSGKSGTERYGAAVEAVARHPELKVTVDPIELGMEQPSYTIRTLDALKVREPENDFTLVVGADNLENIRGWRDWRRILSEFGVAVYPRAGFDIRAARESLLKEPGSESFRISLLDAPVVEISSTQIRNAEAAGRDMSAYRM